jgi:TM2 domain-containing membrane protein YozV
MKRTITHMSVIAMAIMVFLSACSVERRHYRPGFHFNSEVKAPKPEVKKTETAPEPETATAPVETPAEDITAEGVTPVTTAPAAVTVPEAKKVLAYNSNVKAIAKPVTKLGDKFIATNIISKKALHGQSPRGMMADKIISIILCIFLGWLGIHRFYLGFPVSAIIMILLFIMSGVGGFLAINFLAYIAGVLLFVWILYDLICLIMDKPLFFEK